MNYKDIISKAEEKKALAYEKYQMGKDTVPMTNAMQYYMDLSNTFLELIEELKKSDIIDIKRETIQEFQERIGYVSNNHENRNMNLAHMIYVQSVYTHEQKMNWRRQIVRIKKILDEIEKK